MRQKLFILVTGLILSACSYQRQISVTNEDLMVMHFLIEHTIPDTIKKYMDFYIPRFQLPLTGQNMKDGKYKGESPHDDYGYKHVIGFSLKEGKFYDVFYDEVKQKGHSKAADTSYCRLMNNEVKGSAPHLTYPNYIRQLTDKQDLGKIDGVSGATYSLYRFRYAGIRALLNGPVEK